MEGPLNLDIRTKIMCILKPVHQLPLQHPAPKLRPLLQFTAIALALATSAYAWLPAHKELAAFNTTARIGEIAARSLPSLPSGDSKVRGVNLGGMYTTLPAISSNLRKDQAG